MRDLLRMLRSDSDADSTNSDQAESTGEKLFNAAVEGEEDVVRELLKQATAEDVNWQDEVICVTILLPNDKNTLFCAFNSWVVLLLVWKRGSDNGILPGAH